MQININIRNEWKFFSYFKIISRVETASIKLFYRAMYTHSNHTDYMGQIFPWIFLIQCFQMYCCGSVKIKEHKVHLITLCPFQVGRSPKKQFFWNTQNIHFGISFLFINFFLFLFYFIFFKSKMSLKHFVWPEIIFLNFECFWKAKEKSLGRPEPITNFQNCLKFEKEKKKRKCLFSSVMLII